MNGKRIVLTPLQGKTLPIYAETIGFNKHQEKIERPNGYPHYHWLQTLSGKGQFILDSDSYTLDSNCGMLISSYLPHSYYALTNKWTTAYITFDGKLIADLLTHIGIKSNTFFKWEQESPVSSEIISLIDKMEHEKDVFGLHTSTFVYQFLLMINSYARLQENAPVSNHLEKLEPLIEWMKKNLSNPDVGLINFADYLDISPRQLNGIFRDTFNISPYAYFLHLRVRKAKQLLFETKDMTIKQISQTVGFRSPSHFVATFKRVVGLTPEQFRQLQ